LKYNYILTVAFSVTFLFSCASNKHERRKSAPIFVTNITDNGSKLFSFSVSRGTNNGGEGAYKGGHGGGKGGGSRNSDSNQGGNSEEMVKKLQVAMFQKLEEKLLVTEFCREGYFELDSYFTRGASQIRGECNESATEVDRNKFINNQYL